jgi:membrane associated rhomboid family serine protease
MLIFAINFVLVILTGFIFISILFVKELISDYIYHFEPSVAVGYSGILFGFLYVCFARDERIICQPRISGRQIKITFQIIPVVLMVFMSLDPQISFLGHLSGLIAGMLISHKP